MLNATLSLHCRRKRWFFICIKNNTTVSQKNLCGLHVSWNKNITLLTQKKPHRFFEEKKTHLFWQERHHSHDSHYLLSKIGCYVTRCVLYNVIRSYKCHISLDWFSWLKDSRDLKVFLTPCQFRLKTSFKFQNVAFEHIFLAKNFTFV